MWVLSDYVQQTNTDRHLSHTDTNRQTRYRQVKTGRGVSTQWRLTANQHQQTSVTHRHTPTDKVQTRKDRYRCEYLVTTYSRPTPTVICHTHRYKRSESSWPWSASLSHSSVTLGPVLISVSWPWADSELQTQLSYVGGRPHLSHILPLPYRTAFRPVPNYTAWWQRHMGVNNLPRVVTWKRNGQESNPWPLDRKSNALTITTPSHTTHIRIEMFSFLTCVKCKMQNSSFNVINKA